ncbi:glycosyltransferase, partial [Chloroflexota bacterium]
RTKVLWLIKGLNPGGAERLLASVIPYIDRDTFDYEVAYFLASHNELVAEFKQADIPVFCLNLKTPYDPRAPFKLFHLLRDRKPQILHIHLPYTGILGRVIGCIAGVKNRVYTEHSVMEMYHPITRFLNLLTYPLTKTAIMVSDEVKHSVMKHKLAHWTRLLTIRNGVEPVSCRINGVCRDKLKESLGIPTDHRVVGNVAHIRPEKGHYYLVKAAKIVLDQFTDVTFVVVGRENSDGAIRHLKDEAKKLGIQNRLIFTGFRQDVNDIMQIFDIFILPSLYEGLSLALLEAMSLGKPAVASRVGGIPEVITDDFSGFLVPPKNPELLAEKIIQILQDHALFSKMSRNAAQVIREQFSLREMVRQVEHVYSTY